MGQGLLLAAAIWAAAAAEPTSFDLVCTGQIADDQGLARPWTDRLSLDLAAKRWCDRSAGCPYVLPVLARTGDMLQLLAVKTSYNEATMSLDLKTGAVTRSTRIPDRPTSSASAHGVCSRAPFTPLS